MINAETRLTRELAENTLRSLLQLNYYIFHIFLLFFIAPTLPSLPLLFRLLPDVRRHPHPFEARSSRQATVPHHHGSHCGRRSLLSGGSLLRSPAQQQVTNTNPGSFRDTSDMSLLLQHIDPPFPVCTRPHRTTSWDS